MDWNNINRDRDTSGLGPIEYDQTKVPSLIRKHADNVRTKTYGQEVREAQARNAELAGLIAGEAVNTSNETKSRQDTVETQFNSIQQELTDKDVISAPEIIAARNGEDNLSERLEFDFGKRSIQKLNVQSMIDDAKLKVGEIISTVGFNDIFDKGGATYQVVEQSDEVVDGYSLIDLSSGLRAKMLIAQDISARAFGARGNRIDDDTQAIKRAISYAESLKDDETLDRFNKGLTVKLLDGAYKITDTLRITKSNIAIKGESYSGTMIYTENLTADMVVFDGSQKALYGSHISDIRLYSPGNSNAGTQLRFLNVINSINNNLELSAGYEGLEVNGGGKVYFNNTLITQTNRTSGTPTGYLLKVLGDYGIPADIHFTDLQITPNYTTQDYTAVIKSCDGIYFSGFHIHGGFEFSPSNVGNENTLASVFFANSYFDTAREYNISFKGSADAYRNFFFTNTYIRHGSRGINFATTSLLDIFTFMGGKISQQQMSGIFNFSDRARYVTIDGTVFENNNTTNVATEGDVIVSGQKNHVYNTTHIGGGTNGYAVRFKNTSSQSAFNNINTVDSTASKLIVDEGSANAKGSIIGIQKTKNRGSATILSGQTKVTVPHGVGFNLDGANVLVTPRTPLSGGTAYWISNVTATSFDIDLQAIPSQNVIFTWMVDTSR